MDIPNMVMNTCIKHYERLPKTGKPKETEWTIMSAIVGAFRHKDESNLRVLSMGTGSKCIGRRFLSPNGDVLNDSHSEVIARRGFLRYLYLELIELFENGRSDVFYRVRNSNHKVRLKDTVRFYFATTASPCGDASIIPKTESETADNLEDNLGRVIPVSPEDGEEPVAKKRMKMSSGDENRCGGADIHRTGAKCLPTSDIQDPLLPGVLYHQTGAVRTKPGRGDPTLSVSCSDKLARWNAVGIQGALLSIFIEEPVRVDMIVVGDGCPYSYASCNRAINERIGDARMAICKSSAAFPDRRSERRSQPSPNSIIWIRRDDAEGEIQVSVNGRKQGTIKKNMHKKSARTFVCKKELFLLFERVSNVARDKSEVDDSVLTSLKNSNYGEAKRTAVKYQERWKRVKEEFFKVWTEKPKDLLNFAAADE